MKPPAMTDEQIAGAGNALVRVNCYHCMLCLYAADEQPDGGAEAVFDAAGCPDDCPGAASRPPADEGPPPEPEPDGPPRIEPPPTLPSR